MCRVLSHLGMVVGHEGSDSRLKPGDQVQSGEDSHVGLMPLAFTQLAHWELLELGWRSSMRQLACAFIARGALDEDVLKECVNELTRRHDALRAQVVIVNGVPMQRMKEAALPKVFCEKLSSVSTADQNQETIRFINRIILSPVDPCTEEMMAIGIATLNERTHVLVLALDHLISDTYSLNVITKELFGLYTGCATGLPECVSPPVSQFSDYVSWQTHAQPGFQEACRLHWLRDESHQERMRFPKDRMASLDRGAGWDASRFEIDGLLLEEMKAFSRTHGTTLVITAFCAYAALVLRWCDISQGIIRFQIDGRLDQRWLGTVGYFSYPLHVRVALSEGARFSSFLEGIVEEHCRAYESADYSYLESRVPRPEVTRNTVFNWIPCCAADVRMTNERSEKKLSITPLAFETPILPAIHADHDPMAIFYEHGSGISGRMTFSRSQFSRPLMEQFARNYISFLTVMVRRPETLISEIVIE